MRAGSRLAVLLLCAGTLLGASAAAAGSTPEEIGRRIYLEGERAPGVPIQASRADGTRLEGHEAACVNCHRPSGLGSVEGPVVIPPITGRALFGGETVVVRLDRRYDAGLSQTHPPYDDAGFTRVLQDGTAWDGHPLGATMPRYALEGADSAALASYLATLSRNWSPGVDEDTIHLATVITPDVSAERRQAFLATLDAVVRQLNVNVNAGMRQRIPIIERRLHTRRHWSLSVWALQGPPETWETQLDQHLRERPVFALLSGLGGAQWQPVHAFCERQGLVDWFPSVGVVPQSAGRGRYNLYFSGGIGAEAAVIAQRTAASTGRVVTIVGRDALAQAGATALAAALGDRHAEPWTLPDEDAPAAATQELAQALGTLGAGDSLVLWLSAAELARLPVQAPAAQVYVSATVSGETRERLPAAWRPITRLLQPLALGAQRAANLERFDTWRRDTHLPDSDPRMQSEVHFAARALSFTLAGMLNNLYTDYLVERAEAGISLFEETQVQEEIQAMMMSQTGKRPPAAQPPVDPLGPAAAVQRQHFAELLRRGGTTAYPRLSLGPGQRLASKGVYLQRLDVPEDESNPAAAEWVIP